MKYYIDIKILANSEVSFGFLWQKIYLQLHLALVEIKDENECVNIGFSFPKCHDEVFPLGDILRVFANTKEELEAFMIHKWLSTFEEYIFVDEIKEVPLDVKEYVQFKRKQFKSNAERLARRQAKRKNIPFEEALKNYENMNEVMTKLPYVRMKSISTKQDINIFIDKKIVTEEDNSLFNTYGLSKTTATVPWF